ncbi:expansin EXLX1 family cellulose-binding protein [Streptomyces boninensis]|uniref:expansin EXLX1 family cellulose-binding protein n=1 Tax=Streptomyces boninensis TaxID=2039455 RepID=UPI003B224525
MTTTQQAARSHGRGAWTGPPLVLLITAGVLICLTVALLPGREAATQRPAAGAAATESTAPPRSQPPSPSAPTTGQPNPSRRPSATPRSPAPRTSPTRTPRANAAPAAGRIRPGVAYEGVATHYDAADGNGACSYGPSDTVLTAAMNHADYETSRACGAHILVRAASGATVTVLITNECPLPCAPGQLDLSKQAFAELADPVTGRIAVTWRLLSPGARDTIAIRYKPGSSSHWCGIQAIGHRNPLARLEVRNGQGWRRLARTEYNYFLSPTGGGCGGPVRLTDIYGQRLVVDGMAVRPDVIQQTGLQFARH